MGDDWQPITRGKPEVRREELNLTAKKVVDHTEARLKSTARARKTKAVA